MREPINPPVKDRQSEFDQVHRFLEGQNPTLLTNGVETEQPVGDLVSLLSSEA